MRSTNGMLELLKLINVLEEVDGRKKLQKIVHILQSLGHDFPQYFGYLHYGPYSSDLAAEVQYLKNAEFLSETHREGQYESYLYREGDKVPQLLREFGTNAAPKWKDLAVMLNQQNANFLEAVSTIFYLRQTHDPQTVERKFKELKPHLLRQLKKAQAFSQTLQHAS